MGMLPNSCLWSTLNLKNSYNEVSEVLCDVWIQHQWLTLTIIYSWKQRSRGSWPKASPGKISLPWANTLQEPILKILNTKKDRPGEWGVAQVVKYLPSKNKAPSKIKKKWGGNGDHTEQTHVGQKPAVESVWWDSVLNISNTYSSAL
jgi:hypothetical protein